MYLEDIDLSMGRVIEYIHGLSYIEFKHDYEIIWDVASNYLPENKKQIENMLKAER